jgi:hypothetical protein
VENLLHDDSLCGSNLERLSRTNNEVSEQCGLAIPALAIEVSTDQIGGFLICWEENVMRSDMPDREESVPPAPNRSAVYLKA